MLHTQEAGPGFLLLQSSYFIAFECTRVRIVLNFLPLLPVEVKSDYAGFQNETCMFEEERGKLLLSSVLCFVLSESIGYVLLLPLVTP